MSTKQIPTKPSNRAEQDHFLYLCACLSDLLDAQKDMEKRIRLIPRGWWMIRTCTALLKSFLLGLKATFEPEKRKQMQRTADRVRHKLIIGPQVTTEEEQYVIEAKDLGVLVLSAQEQCKLCMGTPANCRSCQLGRVFDGLSFISRQDRAWWEVFEQAKRSDAEEEPEHAEE